MKSDADANYAKILNYNASNLVPLVAQPYLPSNVDEFRFKPFGPIKEIIEARRLTQYNLRRIGVR